MALRGPVRGMATPHHVPTGAQEGQGRAAGDSSHGPRAPAELLDLCTGQLQTGQDPQPCCDMQPHSMAAARALQHTGGPGCTALVFSLLHQ